LRFSLFGVPRPIYSYGLFVVLGVACGLLVTVARARRYQLGRFDLLALGLAGVAGGIFGGTALFVAVHWRQLFADPALFARPGLVFYGGLAGGAVAAATYCRSYKISIARAADAAAPGLALGHAVGRIGCLLGGCCYGRAVAPGFPLAVHVAGAWRLPVPLYEAAGLGALALALLGASTALGWRPGALFALYLGAYALLRLACEPFRGDDLERGFVVPGLISTSQAIAAVALVAAAALFHRVTHKGAAE
jgi:phosphatidylglycerol:prolipoprotein diacylglycerol transferase